MSDNVQQGAPYPGGRRSWVDRYLPGQDGGPQANYGDNALIDVAMIRGILWRQRFVLGGVLAAVMLAGFILTLLMTPRYTATATVRVDPDMGEILQGQDLSPRISTNEISRYLSTLAAVAESRTMAYSVVDSLNLASNDDFLGKAAKAELPDGTTPAQKQAARREVAASILAGSVTAVAPMDKRMIEISFESEDPALAARIANAYAESFATEDIRRNLEANRYAQKFLEEQIAQTRIRLQDAEVRANAYARANRIISKGAAPSSDGDGEGASGGSTIKVASLASVNEAYTQTRAKRIGAEKRWEAISKIPALQLPEVQQSATVQALHTERSKLSGQLSDLLQRYGDNYPEVRELRARINSLTRQIDQAANDIKSSLRNEYRIALGQEQGLLAELDKVSDETLDEQDSRVQFGLLDREAQGLRTQLELLMERYNQIISASNLRSGEITKLDAAIRPTAPSSPNLAKNLIIALLLGTGLAAVLAILREVLDDRLRSVEDVEQKLGLPLLGLTPLVDPGDASGDLPALSEAHSSIRTTVDFALPKPDGNVLVFSSSGAGEGKTTTAAILAQKYAQLGRKVLLVDADLRRPSVASFFGKTRSHNGFVEVLSGDCSFESALLDQPQANLDVLPVGRIPQNPVDVLSSAQLIAFIAKHQPNYSMIMFDAPPMIGLADTPLLARVADGVIFIVEANRANFGQTKAALRRLRDSHAKILGVVLTKFRALDAGLSNDYSYSYYSYGSDGQK